MSSFLSIKVGQPVYARSFPTEAAANEEAKRLSGESKTASAILTFKDGKFHLNYLEDKLLGGKYDIGAALLGQGLSDLRDGFIEKRLVTQDKDDVFIVGIVH